ncbi:MAG: hypothetical protein IJA86_05640 [Clostridia bacterium]|nr:hypothetical protein [Clostridia bacterium]
MIKAEFGIIENFNENGDYTEYCPEKYHCVAIDDDRYLNDWWKALSQIDTFNVYAKGILQPQKALSRWGITVIPPSSLPALLDIVLSDKRSKKDKRLIVFAGLIHQAITENKYMIHYGV